MRCQPSARSVGAFKCSTTLWTLPLVGSTRTILPEFFTKSTPEPAVSPPSWPLKSAITALSPSITPMRPVGRERMKSGSNPCPAIA